MPIGIPRRTKNKLEKTYQDVQEKHGQDVPRRTKSKLEQMYKDVPRTCWKRRAKRYQEKV